MPDDILVSENAYITQNNPWQNAIPGICHEKEYSDHQLEISATGIRPGLSYGSYSVAVTPLSWNIRPYTSFILPRRDADYFDIKCTGCRLHVTLAGSASTHQDAGYERYRYDVDVEKLDGSLLAIIYSKACLQGTGQWFRSWPRLSCGYNIPAGAWIRAGNRSHHLGN